MGTLKGLPPRFIAAPRRLGFAPDLPHEQRRGSAASRGYDGKWSAAAKAFRASRPLCLGCQAVGRVAAATVTDHIVPHKGDMRLFWNRDNWQVACDWHHNVVKQRLEQQWALGQVGEADLRLDSEAARALTLRMEGPTAKGG